MVNESVLNIASKYVGVIAENIKLQKAYLFGSYANGYSREDSDIDIALVVENMNNFFETQMKLMRLRRNIDLRIEPHPISAEDFILENPLAYEILKTGREIEVG